MTACRFGSLKLNIQRQTVVTGLAALVFISGGTGQAMGAATAAESAKAGPAVPVPATSSEAGGASSFFIGPQTIADIAQNVGPSVVNIVSMAPASRLRPQSQRRDDQSRRVRQYFGLAPQEEGSELKITGSGVVVRPDGHILTSLHVVSNATDIQVTLYDGRSFTAKVAGRDNFSDLALIKIECQNLPQVRFASPNTVRPGEWVVAIGNQYGLEHTVTCGLVSGLGREAKAFTPSFGARTGAVKFIQTHAPINPGSSGGPLLNLKGEVIGINSFIRDDAQNIGFAIPAQVAFDVAERLLKQGAISHPYIGIEMRDPSDIPASDVQDGVEITLVKSKGPASLAGLEAGDLIVEVDRNPVKSPQDVSKIVASKTVGDRLSFRIKRHGAEQTLVIRVEKLPEEVD